MFEIDIGDDRSGIRILIVEDSATQAVNLRRILIAEGYAVTVAVDGEEGLLKARAIKPALVISDIQMPRMDGFELCRQVKTDANLKGVPVILLTQLSDPTHVTRAFECGADSFIFKPFDPGQLLLKIETLLLDARVCDVTPNVAVDGALQNLKVEKFLKTTYEAVVQKNNELIRAQEALISANEELKSSTETFANIVEGTTDGILIVDHEGIIKYGNNAAKMLLYGSCEGLVNTPFGYPLSIDTFMEIEVFPDGEGGKIVEIKADKTKWLGEDAFVVVIRDISERKKAEEEKSLLEKQLHQAQKMESLGVLAGGIAHDFNNILAVILCNCALAQQQPQAIAGLIPEIETAANRAAELCHLMLAYAGKTSLTVTQVDFAALIADMLKMLKASIRSNVVILSDLAEGLPLLKGDASQLRQVVMNLIINAAEAIGEKQGEIEVVVKKRVIGQGEAVWDYLDQPIPSGRYLSLEVTDNGCGMDEVIKKRIFEPFFSTKFTGRGLGMSALLGIISSHKGFIQLVSQLGVGTTFRVYLPLEGDEVLASPAPQPSPASERHGDGTILLVEDEPQLVVVAKLLLNSLGYSVIEAVNGQEALDLYRQNSDVITVVMTDIGMPIMDGYQLVAELRKNYPQLPIIVCSGFGDVDIKSKFSSGDISGLINKPYNVEQLSVILNEILGK